jgi:tripartite-type tricarboxylate transporter receptor subunit TctC
MTHIPYKGVSQAVIDVVSGNVQLIFPSPGSAISQVKAGRLRLLAVTTRERVKALPGVPTIAESGVPGYEFSNWWGLLAPRGTPDAIIQRLNLDSRRALQQPGVQARLGGESGEAVGSSSEYFRDYLKAEIAKYAKLVKEVGLKAE